MFRRIEGVLTIALAGAAVVVLITAVGRLTGHSAQSADDELHFVDHWQEAHSFATRVGGDPGAPVEVLALMDLQCPACRAFHEVALQLLLERPRDLELLYVHYPLSYHPQALPAARIAECAAIQSEGAFASWIGAVFQDQRELTSESWAALANQANLPDTIDPYACAEDPRRDGRIKAGLEFGEKIGLRGTPTVIVNGWMYAATPSLEQLRSMVDSILAGELSGRS